MLSYAFHRAGYTTSVAHEAGDALARYKREHPDLVVLELYLGGTKSGFDVLREVRAHGDTPVIVLTALDTEEDKVKGLTLGADDYLTKPFSHRELITRMAKLLERRGASAPRPRRDRIRVGDLELDEATHTVIQSGALLNITVTEFRLLHYLMINAGQVVSTAALLRHVWGQTDRPASDVLRVTLHRLRKKLHEDPSRPTLVQTVPGVGVLLRTDAGPPGPAATEPPAATTPAPSAPARQRSRRRRRPHPPPNRSLRRLPMPMRSSN